ncbi:MAG: hypothetical protein N3E40_05310 [Dehalococcoidia bacterium]|nr:hypothetical protein [Dehalococcoidia bacterium]
MALNNKTLENQLRITADERVRLCQRVISYVESCQVEDGGYFFARIAPASLTDTYYAVSTLAILGKRPERVDRVVNYVNGLNDSDILSDWRGIFAACVVLSIIDSPLTICRDAAIRLLASRGLPLDCLQAHSLYVEVVSELENLASAVSVMCILRLPFDSTGLKSYLANAQNADGSFGSAGRSRIATSFYATQICRILDWSPYFLNKTLDFLKYQEKVWPVAFIEDVFWLCGGLANLGIELECADKAIDFALSCERERGGFSRSNVIGIRTLESTYYGISVLNTAGYFDGLSERRIV